VMNTVCWYEADDKDGTTWYAIDRQVPVTVHFPKAYQPAAQWAIEFSNPIAESLLPITDVPSGCHDA